MFSFSLLEQTYTIDWYDNEGHHNVQSTHHANSVFIDGEVLHNWYYYTAPVLLDTTHFRPNNQIWFTRRN